MVHYYNDIFFRIVRLVADDPLLCFFMTEVIHAIIVLLNDLSIGFIIVQQLFIDPGRICGIKPEFDPVVYRVGGCGGFEK